MSELRKNDVVELTIEQINNLGCGVGRLADGRVVFVRGAVTGEKIEAKIIKVAKSYLVARSERILRASPLRAEEDFCDAPASCGGCVYRQIRYDHEREIKRDYVKNAFRKAGLPSVTVEDVRHAGRECHYRNKAQYPLRMGKGGIEAGFYASKTHTVVAAEQCRIQPEVFSQIVKEFCRKASEMGLSVYDENTGRGLLRHLYLRLAEGTGEIMLCMVINARDFEGASALASYMVQAFPAIVSVMLNENCENTNVVLGKRSRCLLGRDYIEDVLCGMRFRISAESFYQVNHDGAELLYALAAERAGLQGGETLLDLYCGTGTIGLSMAKRAKRLIGVEIVPEAVSCARENAARGGVENAEFICSDATDIRGMAIFDQVDAKECVVVMDPPRKGSTKELITFLSDKGFDRVVYVSCDPDTLARDCVWFSELGYEIGNVTPVDMFPRTGHVESVVRLERRLDVDMRR